MTRFWKYLLYETPIPLGQYVFNIRRELGVYQVAAENEKQQKGDVFSHGLKFF
jgi:hypothetical protein